MPLILIVDDEEDIRWSLKQILRNHDFTFQEASSGKVALELVAQMLPDLVILDLRMPEMDGMETMGKLFQLEPSLPIVVLTGVDSAKIAVQAMKMGAVDYLTKPVDHDELVLVVKKTLSTSGMKRELQVLRGDRSLTGFVAGKSLRMKQLLKLVAEIAGRDISVLIQGESGTGKQMIAEELHRWSTRKDGPFITIDCGAIPESLMESELFGYEKGAFTGANSRKIGKLEVAKSGTVFLDEIGNLTLPLQAKLLRVLETRQFERLGGISNILADFRLISATNANLSKMVERGEFRKDLYYRINIFTLDVPPLRERVEDIPELADHYRQAFNLKHGKNVLRFDEEFRKFILHYSWPGNVRQLKNVIERCVLLAKDEIRLEHLPPEIQERIDPESVLPPETMLKLEELEETALRRALEKYAGDKTRAAAELGISVRTLYYWLKRYNITTPRKSLHQS
jgi:DNA-binding NtrC family response regulator